MVIVRPSKMAEQFFYLTADTYNNTTSHHEGVLLIIVQENYYKKQTKMCTAEKNRDVNDSTFSVVSFSVARLSFQHIRQYSAVKEGGTERRNNFNVNEHSQSRFLRSRLQRVAVLSAVAETTSRSILQRYISRTAHKLLYHQRLKKYMIETVKTRRNCLRSLLCCSLPLRCVENNRMAGHRSGV